LFTHARPYCTHETWSAQVNGIEMFYETDGSGEPLLLLHGGGGCHEDWVHAGRDQFLREYTLLAPDARAIMRHVSVENQSPGEWEVMRKRHKLGDEQIVALREWQRGMKDSYDDMNFTPPSLARITASTLIVDGDRDFLYPVEMAVEMYRAIPRSALLGRAKRRPRPHLPGCQGSVY
jgi:pimeloyl-ACP methyl ester carboxylesterase